jgi:hypothetical protein
MFGPDAKRYYLKYKRWDDFVYKKFIKKLIMWIKWYSH